MCIRTSSLLDFFLILLYKLNCNNLKVPNYPIPRSWLKPIAMFDGRSADEYVGYHYAEKDILSMAKHTDFFFENNAEKTYKAILMDPPFDMSESPVHIPNDDYECPGTVKLADFRKLPMAQIIPKNVGCMLFIWVPPEFTMQINDICEEWGFYLVEHATWIMRKRGMMMILRQCFFFSVSFDLNPMMMPQSMIECTLAILLHLRIDIPMTVMRIVKNLYFVFDFQMDVQKLMNERTAFCIMFR